MARKSKSMRPVRQNRPNWRKVRGTKNALQQFKRSSKLWAKKCKLPDWQEVRV